MAPRNTRPSNLWSESTEVAKISNAAYLRYGLDEVDGIKSLVEKVATLRGLPIKLEQTSDNRWRNTTALMVVYPKYVKIVLRQRDSELYRGRGLLHELAHLILGHTGCGIPVSREIALKHTQGGVVYGRVLSSDEQHELLVSSLDDKQEQQEGEAEYLARLLARPILRARRKSEGRRFG